MSVDIGVSDSVDNPCSSGCPSAPGPSPPVGGRVQGKRECRQSRPMLEKRPLKEWRIRQNAEAPPIRRLVSRLRPHPLTWQGCRDVFSMALAIFSFYCFTGLKLSNPEHRSSTILPCPPSGVVKQCCRISRCSPAGTAFIRRRTPLPRYPSMGCWARATLCM